MSLLVVSSDGYRLLGLDGKELARGEGALARVRGQKVVVGLASELCFAGRVPAIGAKGNALLYRLEEFLPVPAEEVSARFIAGGAESLGVAVQRSRLAEIGSQLRGSTIIGICPTALLAAAMENGTTALHIDNDRISVTGGKVTDWSWGLEPSQGADSSAKAAEAAAAVITGRAELPVDFREKASATGGSRKLVMAATAALIVVIGACWWRAGMYDGVAGRLESDEREAFVKAFPDREVPADVVSRLESEARGTGAVGDVPVREPGSGVMVKVLGCLPANVKFDLTDVRWEGESLTLEGKVATHQDADAIAAALRKGSGFAIGAPSTAQLPDGGVSFSLTGHRGKGGAQ